jgi:hypothetical protein
MVYLKSLGAGIFNLIFAAVIIFYIHMAAYVARLHSESPDVGTWDPVSFVSSAWWVVLAVLLFAVSFYKEFHKLNRKPNP